MMVRNNIERDGAGRIACVFTAVSDISLRLSTPAIYERS